MDKSEKDYRHLLVRSREGAHISEGELHTLDALISPLVRHGQSVHHIFLNKPRPLRIHKKTVCRHIAGGLLHAKNSNMPGLNHSMPF